MNSESGGQLLRQNDLGIYFFLYALPYLSLSGDLNFNYVAEH